MPVEIRGPAQQRDDAVDSGELEERVDGAVVEPRDQRPERQAGTELRPEARLPQRLVRLERARVGSTMTQRGRQYLGGIAPAEQAVVDAATGRRLRETGGIADGH